MSNKFLENEKVVKSIRTLFFRFGCCLSYRKPSQTRNQHLQSLKNTILRSTRGAGAPRAAESRQCSRPTSLLRLQCCGEEFLQEEQRIRTRGDYQFTRSTDIMMS
ncbi:hypothetical protein CDAR_294601 [Caerostris darwini]|uniref:Uncharacterized protein n=1 Tax=Caerostris darwini TaxID=1538125 RepID=A0AAV4UKI2_9ARAC|nr:hypothetical protein CDAR_294601 [Caerostris darwini]